MGIRPATRRYRETDCRVGGRYETGRILCISFDELDEGRSILNDSGQGISSHFLKLYSRGEVQVPEYHSRLWQ